MNSDDNEKVYDLLGVLLAGAIVTTLRIILILAAIKYLRS